MHDYLRSFTLLFTILNPFLLSVYLMDLIRDFEARLFLRILVRGSAIAAAVFALFAWGGDSLFTDLFQVHFASFQVFGGVVFAIISLRFILNGAGAIQEIRGPLEHLAGAIAMPFMIGPGTVSASVLIGSRLPLGGAFAVIGATLAATILTLGGLKLTHDFLKDRSSRLVDRYVEVVGRLSALMAGSIAVEMILQGLHTWLALAGS